MEAVTTVKYLGVTIRSDLKWNDHIKQIVGKAGARLRFIGRILKKCNSSTKEVAYKTLVRPILEYCSSVWDPYQVGLIEEIDMIQRRAARFVMGTFSRRESVTEMLNKLQWQTLQERRYTIRRGLLSKFRESTFREEMGNILLPPTYISRNDHKEKIREIRANTETYKQSFFPRTVREWNREGGSR